MRFPNLISPPPLFFCSFSFLILIQLGVVDLSSRSRTRVQGHAATTTATTTATPGRTGSDWRLTKMILIIFVSFIVCYLPTAIIKIVDKKVERAGKSMAIYVFLFFSSLVKRSRRKITSFLLFVFLFRFFFFSIEFAFICVHLRISTTKDAHVISYVLIYLSACINPIIYVTMNRQFRQAYKDLLFCTGWTPDTKHCTNSASGKT